MRRVLALSALLVVGAAAAASANPVPPVPVHVYQGPNGSVCVVVSEQLPQCTPGTATARR